MTSAGPIGVVISLNRSPVEMVISQRAETASKWSDSRYGDSRGILSRDGAESRITCGRILSCKGKSSRRDHAVDSESKGIKEPRTKGVSFAHCQKLPARIVSCQFVVHFVRLADGPAVKHVCSGELVRRRKLVIDSGRDVIFRGHL